MLAVEFFLERAPWAASIDEQLLQRALEQGFAAARAGNPDIAGELVDFCGYVAEHLTPQGPVLEELAVLHFADLYLAWACARGDRHALVRFEREHVAKVKTFVKKALLPAPGELEQAVLTKLLVPIAGEKPRITGYSGRGPLTAWVRMIATRVALDLRRRNPSVIEPGAVDMPEISGDPELDYLKHRYAAEFNGALEIALGSLSDRDATLLKLTFIDRMSAAAIGTMYGVSGRTVQRWVADIRDVVRAKTSAELKKRLSLSNKELESIFRLMHSRLHVSLHRVLTTRAEGAPTREL